MSRGDHAGWAARGGRTAAVIPAWNEATTVGAVVYAALDARRVDDVVVVDNASTDATAAAAAAHGARVVREPRPGKGEALRAGVAAVADADVVVFLDADLVGLRPGHIDDLVAAVRAGGAAMACGLFDRGPVAPHVGQVEGVEQLASHRPLAGEDRQAGEEDGVGHRAPVEQAAGHGGAAGPHGRHQVVDVARA